MALAFGGDRLLLGDGDVFEACAELVDELDAVPYRSPAEVVVFADEVAVVAASVGFLELDDVGAVVDDLAAVVAVADDRHGTGLEGRVSKNMAGQGSAAGRCWSTCPVSGPASASTARSGLQLRR